MTMTGSCRGCDNKQVINGHTGVHNDKPSPNLWFMSGYKPHKTRNFIAPFFSVDTCGRSFNLQIPLGLVFPGDSNANHDFSPQRNVDFASLFTHWEQSLAVPKGLRSCRTDTRHSLEVENGETMRVDGLFEYMGYPCLIIKHGNRKSWIDGVWKSIH